MAKIFHGGAPVSTPNTQAEAEQLALNYWGDLSYEKFFPIAFWKVKQMLSASNSNQIALRLTDIENPLYVDGSWLVFEELLADTLADPVEENIYYFVFDDILFNGPIITPPPVMTLKGLWKVNNTPQNNIIRARIGRDLTTNKVFVFFQAAECKILSPGGGGGEGASSGFKVPAT